MSQKQKKILWPVLIVIVFAISALVFASTRSGTGAASMTEPGNPRLPRANDAAARSTSITEAVSSAMAQAASARGPVQNVRFILYDAGIFPRELNAKTGTVAIAIEDKTGQTAGLAIELESATGRSAVGNVRCFAGHWRGRSVFRLAPGRYRVSDTSRPGNQAALVIEP